MNKKTLIAFAPGAGAALLACFLVLTLMDIRRAQVSQAQAIQSIENYIGAVQKTGGLPTVDELNARTAKK